MTLPHFSRFRSAAALCCAFAASVAIARAADAPAPLPAAAKDWAATGVFRDEVVLAPDGRFAAGLRGNSLFRVQWDALDGFTDAIVLRLGENPDSAPALLAERLRTTPRTQFTMDSATIPLARAEGGAALRTARFPEGPDGSGVGGRGERDPFVALAWVPDPDAPFPVFGILPDAATPGDRDVLARAFLADPGGTLATGNPRLRPFVLWIGADDPPSPAAVSAALARLGPVADEPAPASAGIPTEAELRALAALVRGLDRSDARRALLACSNALARAAAVFDPGWDPDLEREERLLAEQERRFVRGASPEDALVPWDEVRAWEPQDRVQAAVADLRAAVVDSLAAATGRDEALAALLEKGGQAREKDWSQLFADDTLPLDALHAPPALARALRLDTLLRRLRQTGPGNLSVLSALRARHVRLAAAATGTRERAALHARALREIIATPIDWAAFRTDEYNMSGTDEAGRRQWLQACFDDRDHPDFRPAVVSCYRMAEHLATLRAAMERVADIRFETHVMRFEWADPTNPPPDGARVVVGEEGAEGAAKPAGWVMSARYAESFDSVLSIFANDIWHATSYAMPALAPALCAPFADEIGRVSGERSGSLTSWLADLRWRRSDALLSPDPGPKPGWAPRPFDSGRLLPSPQAGDAELRRELDRYGLTAGMFEQCSQELHPAGTNRLPWLLFAPTNAAPGARIPLVFFAPGSGELGADLRQQFRQRGIFEKICSPDFQARHPCFLLVVPPDEGKQADLYGSLPGGRPTPAQCTMIDALLAVARSQTGPFVDEDRIVGAGLISGSTELVGLARNFPGFFSALALTGSTGLRNPEQDVPESAPSRWWLFGKEGEWGLPGAEEREGLRTHLNDIVRARGGELRFTVFPPSSQTVWDQTWETEELWDWLFSHRRSEPRLRRVLRSQTGPGWFFEIVRTRAE